MVDTRQKARAEAFERAEYHTFAAIRGWLPGGNDPLTGRSWEWTFPRYTDPRRAELPEDPQGYIWEKLTSD